MNDSLNDQHAVFSVKADSNLLKIVGVFQPEGVPVEDAISI